MHARDPPAGPAQGPRVRCRCAGFRQGLDERTVRICVPDEGRGANRAWCGSGGTGTAHICAVERLYEPALSHRVRHTGIREPSSQKGPRRTEFEPAPDDRRLRTAPSELSDIDIDIATADDATEKDWVRDPGYACASVCAIEFRALRSTSCCITSISKALTGINIDIRSGTAVIIVIAERLGRGRRDVEILP